MAFMVRRGDRNGGIYTGSPEMDKEMAGEITRRNDEKRYLTNLYLADFGLTGTQLALELAGKAKPLTDKMPYIAALLAAEQADTTKRAMYNPYGRGAPPANQGWTDVAENSISFINRAGGPVLGTAAQAGLGGMLSELESIRHADREYAEVRDLFKKGDYDGVERLMIGEKSRHWGRNKVSNLFSGKIQKVEDERRAKWAAQYGMANTPEQKRRMLLAEVLDRYHYDEAQAIAPWWETMGMGIKLMRAPVEDEEKILRGWTKEMEEFNRNWNKGNVTIGSKK